MGNGMSSFMRGYNPFVNSKVAATAAAKAASAKAAEAKVPTPGTATSVPVFTPGVMLNPAIAVKPFLAILDRSATELARDAITQLSAAAPQQIKRAIDIVKPIVIGGPGGLMNYLERKVYISEVLNKRQDKWSDDTKADFIAAFRMNPGHALEVQCIVSLAVLNDPDLENMLTAENMPETTESDLMEDREIVWQYPAPGTVLESPGLVLVAVEHKDVAAAEEVVESIIGGLGKYDDFLVPQALVSTLMKLK